MNSVVLDIILFSVFSLFQLLIIGRNLMWSYIYIVG